MKKQDKYAEILTARGYNEKKGKSSKYRVFQNPKSDKYVYLGKSGAIREGKNLKESISFTMMGRFGL